MIYTLRQIKDGTGFAPGARFIPVPESGNVDMYDQGWNDALDDLLARIDNGIARLRRMRDETPEPWERRRLEAKWTGLELARDYVRGMKR